MTRRAPQIGIVLCLSQFLGFTGRCVAAQSAPLAAGLTTADWREDLRALATGLPRRHINAFHAISRSDFNRMVEELDAKLTGFDADHAFVGLASILASVGDGHMGLHLPSDWRRYAVTVTWFGCLAGAAGPCELRITSAAPGLEEALGARVVRINGVTVEEVRSRLATMVTKGESDGAVWATCTALLQFPNVLHGLDVLADPEQSAFELEHPGGARSNLAVPTVPQQTAIAVWRTAAAHDPISRRRVGEPVWWVLVPDTRTAYLTFDSYPEMGALRRLTNDFKRFVEQHDVQRLVIDLRRNNGGDFTKVRRTLLPAIKQHPVLGQRGRLYVLIGPVTFSAAMVNAVDFRREANAILVGLPTGARPNSYSENDEFRLPRSGLIVSYATRDYKFQDEDTPGVMPDQQIHPTWQAFLAGRDLALEWVLAQPL